MSTSDTTEAADVGFERRTWDAISRIVATAEYDVEGRIVQANELFHEIFNAAPGSLVGESHRSLTPPRFAQSAEYRALWNALRNGQVQQGEFCVQTRDGSERYVEAQYSPVLDANTKTIRVVQCARDVTDVRARRIEQHGQMLAVHRALATVEFALDGTILAANDNFLKLMGYLATELVGKHHSIFMPPGEAESPHYREFWRKLRQGEPQTGEFTRHGKLGNAVHINGSYSPIFDEQGKPYKVVKYAYEVTARRLRENELQAQMSAISRTSAIVEFDLDGNIVDANSTFLSVMGYQRDEIVGKHHRIFCLPAAVASPDYEAFWADLRAGKSRSGEFRRVGKGGREVFLQATYTAVLDLNGRPFKVMKFASDTTAQKRMALNFQGQHEAISRTMAIIEFNLDGTIIDANPLFEASLGYTREELIGRHHRMFVDAAYADSAEYRDLWTRIRSGEPLAMKFKRIGKNGRVVYLEASYNPILDLDGKPFKCVKYAQDVTQQTLDAQRVEAERTALLAEGARIKSALDASMTNVLVADDQFNIVYLNESMRKLLRRHQAAFAAQLPQFSVDSLIGGSIDRFHRVPQRTRQMLQHMTEPIRTELNVGGRVLDQVVVSTKGPDGKVVGYAVEWLDRTDEILAQREVEQILKSSISGDLTMRMDTSRLQGFVAQVGKGMNALLDTISDSLRHVKSAVDQIGQASQELRATSQMMSSSSVELNSAAESSSTSLARAASMVKSNAESASMANQLVTATAEAAQSGQSRMQEMGSAMSAINTSAQQIAKIIKVIDEIAFQTNLLALNAAVEAARAGRHGKGFAVVAQEVRSLAERSAKAAKETAALIEDAVAKVAQGVKMAESTGEALNGILGNVTKVVDLAGEIASASDEQSRTIESVAVAMNQVSENAQSGSQQSSEVASSAEELGRQMEVLLERLRNFKLASVNEVAALPAGVSPELIEQIAAMLMSRGLLKPGQTPQHNDNQVSAREQPRRGPGEQPQAATGTDPRVVLPLDRDERGFGGF